MARRYLLHPLGESDTTKAPRELAHHLCSVMRCRVGEQVRLFDGQGLEAEAEILVCKRDQVELRIGTVSQVLREPGLELSIAFPLPRGSRCDWLLEHGCELGIRHFYPISSERSRRAGPDSRRNRWLRILSAAAGQCDRSHVPVLHHANSLATFLLRDDLPLERYIASSSNLEMGAAQSHRALLLVGPEGGFSPKEVKEILARGFSPRALGPLTLRSETAALAGAARLLQSSQAHGTG